MLPRYQTIEANLDYKLEKRNGMLTTEEYICNLKRHGIITTIPDEQYKGTNTSIYHICKIHNYRFKAQPSNIMNGYPCPLCNKENNRINNEKNYKQKLRDKNIPVLLDDKYVDHSTKVYHICLHCNNRWKTTPSYVLRNKFPCPKCAKVETSKTRAKTLAQFNHEIYKIFGDTLSIVGDYKGAQNKIDVHCNICNHNWSPLASNILSGHGCPKCTNHYTMSHEEFLIKIADYKNDNIEILGKYKNSKAPIQCRCKVCGKVWNTNLDRILQGNGCKECSNIERAKLRTISLDEIIKRLHKRFPYIDIVGEYKNVRTKTICKCNVCNNTWSTEISALLVQKYGCPKCAIEANKVSQQKSHDSYVLDVLSFNPYIKILSEYAGCSNNIKAKCLICNNEWLTKAQNLLRCGCPKCASSKLELLVQKYLDNYNIIYNKTAKYPTLLGVRNGMLSYDFYLPQYHLLIECQGEQHERPVRYFGGQKRFVIQKIHDTRKRRYAHDNNINLLEIWYYEEKKIDKILTQTLNNLKSLCRETVTVA